MRTKVLIVDDSAIVRQTLEKELGADPNIEVIGTAQDPYVAREKIIRLKPDVITLDIEMPRMDGLTFLRKLMKHYPIPTVIVSSLSKEGSETALEAVASGAIGVFEKPGAAYAVGDLGIQLREIIKGAKSININKVMESAKKTTKIDVNSIKTLNKTTHKVVVIGSSTGGTQALESIITKLPANAPGMAIVQHMPAGFTKTFAERINAISAVEVKEAENGDTIIPGRVLIAPGNYHMLMNRSGAVFSVIIKQGPLVGRHRPAVDVLFKSSAQQLGKNAIAVMLTGMGKDGAEGMLKLREAGAKTIAQNEETCVVYGMPKAAYEIGAVEKLLPLSDIASEILKLA